VHGFLAYCESSETCRDLHHGFHFLPQPLVTSSLRRINFPASSSLVSRGGGLVAVLLLALTGFIVARGCGYDLVALLKYAGYLSCYVVLPGLVVMHAVNRNTISLATAVALAVPTGFALEIFTFLGFSAMGVKSLYAWTPLGWALLACALRYRSGAWSLHTRISTGNGVRWAGLALAFCGTALLASSQMFAESPLADGLPTRAIFHDWVYLVSRAGAIKNHWPLDDPSLSGTPLQYHFFLMAHAAAASWTTGIEITAVLLRLVYVPLGAVLVAQAYVLGRDVSSSPWGGVLAALLTVVASELSFAPSFGEPMYLGLFVRWMFVSPTFFFGLIFCGALLIAVAQCLRVPRCGVVSYIWVLCLAAAGTGAKGTVLPVIICALALWTAGCWIRQGRLPWRAVGLGTCLVVGFALVYIPAMSSWRTGDAAFRPFHVMEITQFWRDFPRAWTVLLTQWLPAGVAKWVVLLGCAVIVFAGTLGVRLLALPYLFWHDAKGRDPLLTGWLGAFFFASAGMGMLLHLNSHGELYLLLMVRLPSAVLTAGFIVAASWRFVAWRAERSAVNAVGTRTALATGMIASGRSAGGWGRPALVTGAVAVCVMALAVQASMGWKRNQRGLREWLATPVDLKPDEYMQNLRQALLWVRENTERNAVLVTNTCTPENMRKDHWGALDRTLTGVHFYYSALSERRLWFEGPSYIQDTSRARLRANMASNFFYRGRALPSRIISAGPCYALIDLSLGDGAYVALPLEQRVFTNSRIQVYRLLAAAE